MNGEAATPSGEATLLRVLLVELEGPARDGRQAALSAAGLLVDAEGDLQRAAARLVRGRFDVVVCARALLDEGQLPPARIAEAAGAAVVLLIDSPDDEVLAEAVEAGAYDGAPSDVSHEELGALLLRAASYRARQAQDGEEEAILRERIARQEARLADLEDRLAAAERDVDPDRRLGHLIVHDLKNQIAVVRSNLAYVLEETPAGDTRGLLEDAADAFDPVLPRALALAMPSGG